MTLRVVDWVAVFTDLRRAFRDDAAISRALGGNVSPSAVRLYVSDGAQPLHSRGELILALWIQTTGQDRDAVPTRPAFAGHHAIDRRARGPASEMSAYDALDAVFRPNLNITEVFARVTARQNAKDRPNGDRNTLTLPGFE